MSKYKYILNGSDCKASDIIKIEKEKYFENKRRLIDCASDLLWVNWPKRLKWFSLVINVYTTDYELNCYWYGLKIYIDLFTIRMCDFLSANVIFHLVTVHWFITKSILRSHRHLEHSRCGFKILASQKLVELHRMCSNEIKIYLRYRKRRHAKMCLYAPKNRVCCLTHRIVRHWNGTKIDGEWEENKVESIDTAVSCAFCFRLSSLLAFESLRTYHIRHPPYLNASSIFALFFFCTHRTTTYNRITIQFYFRCETKMAKHENRTENWPSKFECIYLECVSFVYTYIYLLRIRWRNVEEKRQLADEMIKTFDSIQEIHSVR